MNVPLIDASMTLHCYDVMKKSINSSEMSNMRWMQINNIGLMFVDHQFSLPSSSLQA